MELKSGPAVHVKITDEAKGEVEAVFSTLNVVDKDGDVTFPGAFGDQKVRISAYNHKSWAGELPVGKGSILERADEGILKGQFFMDTTAGRDHFNVIKNLPDLMEWSYGYDILERADGMWPPDDTNGQQVQFLKKLKVHEVSPVILGAGVDTRTLSAKGIGKGAIGYSKTGTTDVPWDAAAMWSNCPMSAAPLKAACAWVDPSGNADAKSSYKFIHHMVGDNGAVGAANTVACSAAIAVLNGGRGGTVIPDADRQGVYNHAAHHLEDAGKTPPPLKSREEIERNGAALFDQLSWANYVLDEVSTRVAEAVAMRAEKGEQLAEPTKDLVTLMISGSERLREAVAIEPRKSIDQEQLQAQAALVVRNAQALLHLSGGYSNES